MVFIEFYDVKFIDYGPVYGIIRRILDYTMDHTYLKNKETGRFDAFELKWRSGNPRRPHIFWDSDVAKWIESAAYALYINPEGTISDRLNEVIRSVQHAQQSDGYINPYFTVVEPDNRFGNLADNHELYCAGHLIEAGVAHYQSTGDSELLNTVMKYTDYICDTFGPEEGKIRGYPGHQEIEHALFRLYTLTGIRKYAETAAFFLDERGNWPNYFVMESGKIGRRIPGGIGGIMEFLKHRQAHIPIREQKEAVGHAVRAQYMYTAMCEYAEIMEDPSLFEICKVIWKDVTEKKMYITGGLGSDPKTEGFSVPYDLPDTTAYCETCASIAFVFWNKAMFRTDKKGKYFDMIELALYNNIAGALSADGRSFYYSNPLRITHIDPPHRRQPWFSCACCPNNLTRLFLSIGGYIYAVDNSKGPHLYINLYIPSVTDLFIVPDGKFVYTPILYLPEIEENGYIRDPDVRIKKYSAYYERNGKNLPVGSVVGIDGGPAKPEKIKVYLNGDYPINGKITVLFEFSEKNAEYDFTVKLRIPSFPGCDNTLDVYTGNLPEKLKEIYRKTYLSEPPPESSCFTAGMPGDGYIGIRRNWRDGDFIYLNLHPKPVPIFAATEVPYYRGKVAFMRGPIVYCFEEIDNGSNLSAVMADTRRAPEEVFRSPVYQSISDLKSDMLPPVLIIKGFREKSNGGLYGTERPVISRTELTAVPFFIRANRDGKEMCVWLREYRE